MTNAQQLLDSPSAHHSRLLLVVAASSVGTVFEWYDFFIFGSLAAIIGRHFFAGVGEARAYLFALLTFAAGFAVRPFGAIVFGWFGDRTGRKRTFLVTISVMGFATFIVAVLPDQSTIGVVAPYWLVALRMLQGFAIGGEYGGAAIYVAEHTVARRRGFATSWIQSAAGIGLALALIVILIARTVIGETAFEAWGWRVPFAVSLLLLAFSLWIRLKLAESPEFLRIQAEGTLSSAPLAEAFLQWKNLRLVLTVLFAILAGQGVVWYTAQFYSQFFLERIIAVPPATVNATAACGHARIGAALPVLWVAVGSHRSQARDAVRTRPRRAQLHSGIPSTDRGREPGACPRQGARARGRRLAARGLLAAIRSDRQREVRHGLRHRQGGIDQSRCRLHQPRGPVGDAGRDSHRPSADRERRCRKISARRHFRWHCRSSGRG